MKGYLTTCDGAQFELPTLLKWEFSYTGSVPCDSFTLRCTYEAAMAETLRRAVRFTAKENGAVEFAGVVDETSVTCDEKGLQLELSGRGMAALLLDNAAGAGGCRWRACFTGDAAPSAPYAEPNTGNSCPTATCMHAPMRSVPNACHWNATGCCGSISRARPTCSNAIPARGY